MFKVVGFPPIYHRNATILVLGSMPGQASLDFSEYYAHPRNVFWRILSDVHKQTLPNNYDEKRNLLRCYRYALWDVLHACERRGSLDINIVASTEQPNDIESIVRECADLRRIVFNGKKAEQVFRRAQLKRSPNAFSHLQLISAPSTSPANASTSYADKLAQWSQALDLHQA